MANDETLAALERLLLRLPIPPEKAAQAMTDAALIRAHIETLRNGGERAQIVAYLHECRLIHEANATRKGQVTARRHHIDACTHIADAIAAGAHGKESGVPLK